MRCPHALALCALVACRSAPSSVAPSGRTPLRVTVNAGFRINAPPVTGKIGRAHV